MRIVAQPMRQGGNRTVMAPHNSGHNSGHNSAQLWSTATTPAIEKECEASAQLHTSRRHSTFAAAPRRNMAILRPVWPHGEDSRLGNAMASVWPLGLPVADSVAAKNASPLWQNSIAFLHSCKLANSIQGCKNASLQVCKPEICLGACILNHNDIGILRTRAQGFHFILGCLSGVHPAASL